MSGLTLFGGDGKWAIYQPGNPPNAVWRTKAGLFRPTGASRCVVATNVSGSSAAGLGVTGGSLVFPRTGELWLSPRLSRT